MRTAFLMLLSPAYRELSDDIKPVHSFGGKYLGATAFAGRRATPQRQAHGTYESASFLLISRTVVEPYYKGCRTARTRRSRLTLVDKFRIVREATTS